MGNAAAASVQIVRTDRYQVRIDAGTTVRHANGWIDAWGTATRTGVLPYPEHGTLENRPPEEVLDPASLATLLGIPLTIRHPDGLVDSANVRQLTHGWVLGWRVDDSVRPALVHTQIRFASDDVRADLDSGTVELSLGYLAEYEAGEGVTPEGEPYTGTQRRIRYNHLALVPDARAGHVARVTLDSSSPRNPTMRTFRHGSIIRSIPAFVADDLARQAAALVRTDAMEVAPVSIDGQDLVLPRALVDQILAMLGAGPAPEMVAELDADQPPADQPPADPNAPRMDAAMESAIERIAARVVAAALADQRRADAVVRQAAEVLGRAPSATDEIGALAEAIVHRDAAAAPRVAQLATAARRGDLRAAGELAGMLGPVTPRRTVDAAIGEGVAELAGAIDGVRRDSAREEPKPGSSAARARMIERRNSAGRATAPAAKT